MKNSSILFINQHKNCQFINKEVYKVANSQAQTEFLVHPNSPKKFPMFEISGNLQLFLLISKHGQKQIEADSTNINLSGK